MGNDQTHKPGEIATRTHRARGASTPPGTWYKSAGVIVHTLKNRRHTRPDVSGKRRKIFEQGNSDPVSWVSPGQIGGIKK